MLKGRATFTRKEEILALLKEDFFKKVDEYVSAVTAAIRDEPPTQAEKIFQSAVAFLSQEMPNPTSRAITPLQSTPTASKTTPEKSPPTNLPIRPVVSIANPSPISSAESSPTASPIPKLLDEVRQTTTFVPTLTAVAESANLTTQKCSVMVVFVFPAHSVSPSLASATQFIP
ncbi:hypothetical protein PoB_003221600 [Plakobranchus ocellatus]|uniref:Uncharacterized protein n=1 Tax=Plakobranchus ocellatus TaxID=259542 RepID=A0AAV4A353_9GAST|nr:hypothetical protein PoB_003221600 [Plakobranchus ocellatus]